jgi:hypothetical protein
MKKNTGKPFGRGARVALISRAGGSLSRGIFVAQLALLICASITSARPQDGAPNSGGLAAQANEGPRVPLKGGLHPLAQAQFDRGAIADQTSASHLLLVMARPAERQVALEQFLRDAHTPGSASYHRWITPQQFGMRFGAQPEDIQRVSAWLTAHGFAIEAGSANATFIRFSGNAGQLRSAFGAEIHAYDVNGQIHHGNAGELSVPAWLASAIAGLAPLNDFNARPQSISAGSTTYKLKAKGARPQFTVQGSNGIAYALAPEDFATQYDVEPLYTAGVDGAGVTIGIVGGSNVDLTVLANYRALFSLPANPPQIVIDGNDPGDVPGADVEAYLDLEESGAIAPNATINFYLSGGSLVADPLYYAALRAVDDDQADIISLSFSQCENTLGLQGNQIFDALWEQAAAQGQTVLVASNDNGSAGCDDGATQFTTDEGLAVNGLASTPWNVAVGGTDFYYSDYATGGASAGTAWNQTNDSSYGSLKSPLPEQVWDTFFGFNAATQYSGAQAFSIPAGGGGPSSCIESGLVPDPMPGQPLATCGAVPGTTIAGYPKPSWQSGTGVPADGVRDVPDVSLFAADLSNFSAYPVCLSEADCVAAAGQTGQIQLVGGTSASTPAMAGILALVDQKYGRQGQADFVLYALAKSQPSVFHDITKGTNNMRCIVNTVDCKADTADTYDSLQEYPATAGYDLASGLGSVDATLLVNSWKTAALKASETTFTFSPATMVSGTLPVVTAAVKPTNGGGSPQGAITIETNAGDPLIAGGVATYTLDANGKVPEGTQATSSHTLPVGTYQIWAEYSGDGVFAPSNSAPQTITVSAAASTLQFSVYNIGNAFPDPATFCTAFLPPDSYVPSEATPLASGAQLSIGAPLVVQAQASAGGTGAVTFTLDSEPAVSVPLIAFGTATWAPPQTLGAGTHTIDATYNGSGGFASATAAPFSYALTPATPNLWITPNGNCTVVDPLGNPTYPCAFNAGDTLTVEIQVNSYGCHIPTGTVTVNLGNSLTQTVSLTPAPIAEHGASQAFATATFPNFPAGAFPVSASYSGDSSLNPLAIQSLGQAIVVATTPPGPLAKVTTTVVANPPSIVGLGPFDGSYVLFNVTVTAAPGTTAAPTGSVTVFSEGEELVPVALTPSGPLTSTGTSGPVTIQALTQGQNMITALYSGDANYAASEGTTSFLLESVDVPDFTMALTQPELTLAAGGNGNVGVNLSTFAGFSGALNFTCSPSSSSIVCSVAPTTKTLNGPAAITVNVSAAGVAAKRASAIPAVGADPSRDFGAGRRVLTATVVAFAYACLWMFCGAGRGRAWMRAGVLTAAIAIIASCGGGTSSGGGGGTGGGGTGGGVTPPASTSTTYSVVVTAASSTTAHNVKLLVQVQ